VTSRAEASPPVSAAGKQVTSGKRMLACCSPMGHSWGASSSGVVASLSREDRFVVSQEIPAGDDADWEPDAPLDGAFGVGDVTLMRLPDHTLVLLAGDVDLALSDELTQACSDAIDLAQPIRLDVSAVTFIDSTALGFVARLASAERDHGRTLRVTGSTRRTTETIRLMGLEELLDLE